MHLIKTRSLTTKSRKKGFTLTEIAIVLGIIGLILGAIWTAASSVYANQKATKATTEVLSILQGVRTLYASQSVTGDVDGTSETATYFTAGAFPSDMGTTAATLVNPWGGTVGVISGTYTTTGDSIIMEFSKVSNAGCANLISATAGASRDSGVVYANATGTTKIGAALTITGGGLMGSTPATVTPTAAAGVCTNTSNFVQLGFKLKS